MIKCIDKYCPYFDKITLQIGNKEIEEDCVKGFHPEGYCERLQAFCDTKIQGEDCNGNGSNIREYIILPDFPLG